MIKHTNALNYCRARSKMINKQTTGCECSRCSDPETQDCVIECRKIREFWQKFVEELLTELIKNRLVEIDYRELFDIRVDMLIYLETGNEEEHATNQHMIGMRYLFRGH